jgi:two-component sensor histidine kinase
MHGRRIKSQEARDILESVRGCVYAIASAQRRVRLAGTNDLVEVGPFLESLIHDLRRALAGSEHVIIELKFDEVVAPSHDAVSIGVIVTEAINNAIKYASRDDTSLAISVALKGDESKKLHRVTVEDNGAGYDESGSSAGLGSQISEALAMSLRAQLIRSHVMPTGPRRGTRIELDFTTDAVAA